MFSSSELRSRKTIADPQGTTQPLKKVTGGFSPLTNASQPYILCNIKNEKQCIAIVLLNSAHIR